MNKHRYLRNTRIVGSASGSFNINNGKFHGNGCLPKIINLYFRIMKKTILILQLFFVGICIHAQYTVEASKELDMGGLMHNEYEIGEIFVYNHGCICTTCKEADFVCVKLPDSPFSSIAEWLKARPTTIVEFRLYTEIRGNTASNQKYTEKKAKELSDILVSLGVPATQFSCKGYGSSARIMISDVTGKKSKYVFKAGTTLDEKFLNNILTSVSYDAFEDGHRLNRRIEMKIIAK